MVAFFITGIFSSYAENIIVKYDSIVEYKYLFDSEYLGTVGIIYKW
ncbi:MAG: hypothetical protein ACRDB9_08565 [Cetobacterium sp.]